MEREIRLFELNWFTYKFTDQYPHVFFHRRYQLVLKKYDQLDEQTHAGKTESFRKPILDEGFMVVNIVFMYM